MLFIFFKFRFGYPYNTLVAPNPAHALLSASATACSQHLQLWLFEYLPHPDGEGFILYFPSTFRPVTGNRRPAISVPLKWWLASFPTSIRWQASFPTSVRQWGFFSTSGDRRHFWPASGDKFPFQPLARIEVCYICFFNWIGLGMDRFFFWVHFWCLEDLPSNLSR